MTKYKTLTIDIQAPAIVLKASSFKFGGANFEIKTSSVEVKALTISLSESTVKF